MLCSTFTISPLDSDDNPSCLFAQNNITKATLVDTRPISRKFPRDIDDYPTSIAIFPIDYVGDSTHEFKSRIDCACHDECENLLDICSNTESNSVIPVDRKDGRNNNSAVLSVGNIFRDSDDESADDSNDESADDSDDDPRDLPTKIIDSLGPKFSSQFDEMHYNSHYSCYCRTSRVCGCGCDRDHDGW